MAEYADYLVERMSNPAFFGMDRQHYPRVERWDYKDPDNCVWTKADGTRLRFADMTTKHRSYALRAMARKNGLNGWDTPTGRALVACGVHDWVRVELGVPTELPELPKYFETNQDEGVPR